MAVKVTGGVKIADQNLVIFRTVYERNEPGLQKSRFNWLHSPNALHFIAASNDVEKVEEDMYSAPEYALRLL